MKMNQVSKSSKVKYRHEQKSINNSTINSTINSTNKSTTTVESNIEHRSSTTKVDVPANNRSLPNVVKMLVSEMTVQA